MPTNYYELTRPAKIKAEDFERFVTEEVFPAVGRGPSRVGDVTGLRLLKEVPPTRKYLWTIEWGGLRLFEGFTEGAFAKVKASGARMKLLGTL
ncbi:MAG TPA: hypothetical protein VF546_00975 [Pyrinomonadaceae bacterium]